MVISVPPFYTAALDYLDSPIGAAAERKRIQFPLQLKKDRERQRAWLAQKPPPRPYTPFFIPERILDKKQSSSQTQSPLFRLPNEILLLVTEKVEVPHFQVVFGLTCKSIASLLSSNREVLTPWRGFRDKEGLYRLLARQPPSSSAPAKRRRKVMVDEEANLEALTIQDNIQDQVKDTAPPYIPDRLTLCRACWRHVPQDEWYWFQRITREEFDRPHVNYFDILNFFGEAKRNCGQHKCPGCCVRNYTCFMSQAEYEKALGEDYQDEEIYLIDLGDEGRRVCIEVPARLARP